MIFIYIYIYIYSSIHILYVYYIITLLLGFETLTCTIEGVIDHADSMGNGGRYGYGDNQWMTAGKGIVHGEMFPLVHSDKPNHTRFFQIWLNLPKKNKMVDPYFTMVSI